MHALLAASALHIRETSKTDSLALVEAGHWLHASSGFRKELMALSSETRPDPLLTTCMLLNLLSFANVSRTEDVKKRWPFVNHDEKGQDALQWLRVQLGLSPLLTGLSEKTKGDSIWLSLFMASGHDMLYD